MRLHAFYRGKTQTTLKCLVRDFGDFAIWYMPGVAAPCRAIQVEPELVWAHTNGANTIAIVTDGTRDGIALEKFDRVTGEELTPSALLEEEAPTGLVHAINRRTAGHCPKALIERGRQANESFAKPSNDRYQDALPWGDPISL